MSFSIVDPPVVNIGLTLSALDLGSGQANLVDEATLSIGDLARRAGVSVSAIRFYERRGLLSEPERLGGRRRYGTAAVRRLGVIAAAKRGGFSLTEIGALLAAADAGAAAPELRALATRKLPEIDAAIERAKGTRAWLLAAGECGCETLAACALFE